MQPKSTPSQPGYTCEACGQKFHAERKGRRFCSRPCKDRGQAAFWQSRRDAVEQAGVKTCTKCGETKPLDAFGKHRDGVRAKCFDCMREEGWAWYHADPEKTKAYYRNSYRRNRERWLTASRQWKERNRDRVLAYQRRYNEENRDIKIERQREARVLTPKAVIASDQRRWYQDRKRTGALQRWQEANRGRIAENGRKWRLANPERNAEKSRRYAASKRRQRALQPADYRLVLQEHGAVCYLCDKSLKRPDLSFDHVVPLARGGEHRLENLRPCCRRCNSRKGARLWHEISDEYPEMAYRIRDTIT